MTFESDPKSHSSLLIAGSQALLPALPQYFLHCLSALYALHPMVAVAASLLLARGSQVPLGVALTKWSFSTCVRVLAVIPSLTY